MTNGDSLPIIKRVMFDTLNRKPPVTVDDLKPVCISLPLLGNLSSSFQNRIHRATKSIVHQCKPICCFTSRHMFSTCRKDHLPADQISNVVFLFSCHCGGSYVNRTSQRLEEKLKQHILPGLAERTLSSATTKKAKGRPWKNPNVLAPSKSDSAITRHLKNSVSCLSAVRQNIQHHFRVLAKARDWAHLSTLEAVFIASKEPALCAQKEHVKALRLL